MDEREREPTKPGKWEPVMMAAAVGKMAGGGDSPSWAGDSVTYPNGDVEAEPVELELPEPVELPALESAFARGELTVRVLGDRVLLEVEPDKERKSASGLIVAGDEQKSRHRRGKVIGVGPGNHAMDGSLIEPRIKVGDVVLFSKHGGERIDTEVLEEQGEYGIHFSHKLELITLRESELIAVIEHVTPEELALADAFTADNPRQALEALGGYKDDVEAVAAFVEKEA
jgi:chaperonin GroES